MASAMNNVNNNASFDLMMKTLEKNILDKNILTVKPRSKNSTNENASAVANNVANTPMIDIKKQIELNNIIIQNINKWVPYIIKHVFGYEGHVYSTFIKEKIQIMYGNSELLGDVLLECLIGKNKITIYKGDNGLRECFTDNPFFGEISRRLPKDKDDLAKIIGSKFFYNININNELKGNKTTLNDFLKEKTEIIVKKYNDSIGHDPDQIDEYIMDRIITLCAIQYVLVCNDSIDINDLKEKTKLSIISRLRFKYIDHNNTEIYILGESDVNEFVGDNGDPPLNPPNPERPPAIEPELTLRQMPTGSSYLNINGNGNEALPGTTYITQHNNEVVPPYTAINHILPQYTPNANNTNASGGSRRTHKNKSRKTKMRKVHRKTRRVIQKKK
jgi:hypothetical protein